MNQKELQKKARSLPRAPGVYLMKDEQGRIIYVGKAKILPNRVSSYFLPQKSHSEKIRRMVGKIFDFDFVVCENEFEALVLECNFIKQHQPKYNILLKDDKAYPYLRATVHQPYPKLSLARKVKNDSSCYFGPYSSSSAVYEAIKLSQKTFHIATCGREFPRDIGKGRPCLNYHIKQCCGPCIGAVSQQDYKAIFDEILLFLQGDYERALALVEKNMLDASEAMEYERAARYRDRLAALKKLGERQKVIAGEDIDQDVFGYFGDEFGACVQILRIRTGKLSDNEYLLFGSDDTGDPEALMTELLKGYYTRRPDYPSRVLLSHMQEEANLIERYLSGLSGKRVELKVPQRGNPKRLVEMAIENARQTLLSKSSGKARREEALGELACAAGLDAFPTRIEAFDISHTGGTQTVGGMVVFIDGEPKKSEYRRYKINTVEGADDYGALREALTRRLNRALSDMRCDADGEPEILLPDLILVDGGRGQVSAALEVLERLNIDLPVLGMVKDDAHKTKALMSREGEISLSVNKKAFSLIFQIQEEVHRFALSYHKTLRDGRMKHSELEKIDGIGPARAKALLRHFKTLQGIKTADKEGLLKVPEMTESAATAVLKHFEAQGKE